MNQEIRCIALKRQEMADGDGIIIQHDVPMIGASGAVIPLPFFCHHIVSEASPFYDPNARTSCSFKGGRAIFISVAGMDPVRQEDHCGY